MKRDRNCFLKVTVKHANISRVNGAKRAEIR